MSTNVNIEMCFPICMPCLRLIHFALLNDTTLGDSYTLNKDNEFLLVG